MSRAAKTTSLAAQPRELPPVISQYLAETGMSMSSASLQTIDDLDQLAADFRRADSAELAIRIWRGAKLAAIRDHMPSEFAPFLARIGQTRSSAYQHIDLLTALGELKSVESVHTCGQLDFAKQRAIVSWPSEDREAFLAGATVRGLSIETASEMSFREFHAAEQKWRQETLARDEALKESARKITALETRISDYERDAQARQGMLSESDLPEFAREARMESMVFGEQLAAAIESLEDVAGRTLLKAIAHHQAERFQPLAARTFVHALAAPIARASKLLAEVCEAHGIDPAQPVTIQTRLEPSELKTFDERREQLLAAHAEGIKERSDERHNTAPGKRGRNRGTAKRGSR